MPLSQRDLIVAASSVQRTRARSLSEAQHIGQRTAFLSHSHQDQILAQGLASRLTAEGFDVYIDWVDTAMPSTPDRETAERIQNKISGLDLFLFLATANSMSSRWCPWELGYADGKKQRSSILIVPTQDVSNSWYGNEYLQVYYKLDHAAQGPLAVFGPGAKGGVYVREF